MAATTDTVLEIESLHIEPGEDNTLVLSLELVSDGPMPGLTRNHVFLTRLGSRDSSDLAIDRVRLSGRQLAIHLVKQDSYVDHMSIYQIEIGSSPDDPFCRTRFSLESSRVRDRSEEPTSVGPHFEIDYMARDFGSLVPFLFEQMSRLIPGWRERHLPDQGVALVELLAHVGDYFSYYQDAIATEAYLDTARLRTSVRRHARLLDYHMHEGCSARALVHVRVHKRPLTLPKGALFASGLQNDRATLLKNTVSFDKAVESNLPFFTSLHALDLFPAHNEIAIHTWGRPRFVLSKGTTTATLEGQLDLEAGDVLIFEERISPANGRAEDANPKARCAVRLTEVRPLERDRRHSHESPLVRVRWHSGDALPFDLPVALQRGAVVLNNITVARGNILLAEHGIEKRDIDLPVVDSNRYRPALPSYELCFRQPYRHEVAREASARDQLNPDPRNAMPAIELWESDPTGRMRHRWLPRKDLLSCTELERCFTVEMDDDRRAVLRFGDGFQGWQPDRGHRFRAHILHGTGADGNVGQDTISAMVVEPSFFLHTTSIEAVRNPLPANGGHDPESVDRVRRYAPEAYQRQDRCVTETDYARHAEGYPEVDRAVARIHWTGCWYTVALLVDRKDGLPIDAEFIQRLRAHMKPSAMIGHDLEIGPPEMVALTITLRVEVEREHARNAVRGELMELFSSRVGRTGEPGFFHPDRWTFGQPVYLSPIITRALAVEGVAWVEATVFARRDAPSGQNLASGKIEIGPLEVARLDNNPAFPEMGTLTLEMSGGI